MKLLLQNDDNTTVEIKEITSLNKNSEVLFFFLKGCYRQEDITIMENKLQDKIGKKVVIIDNRFAEKIMGI